MLENVDKGLEGMERGTEREAKKEKETKIETEEIGKIKELLSEMEEKDIILTVGNPLREDDGVGYYIYKRISAVRNPRTLVFHTDQNPSIGINLAEIYHPKRMLFIDGADFGGAPGETRLIDSKEVEDAFLSTHEIPISLIGEGIRAEYECSVYYVGIQVKNVGYGDEISEEVREGAEKLIKLT